MIKYWRNYQQRWKQKSRRNWRQQNYMPKWKGHSLNKKTSEIDQWGIHWSLKIFQVSRINQGKIPPGSWLTSSHVSWILHILSKLIFKSAEPSKTSNIKRTIKNKPTGFKADVYPVCQLEHWRKNQKSYNWKKLETENFSSA